MKTSSFDFSTLLLKIYLSNVFPSSETRAMESHSHSIKSSSTVKKSSTPCQQLNRVLWECGQHSTRTIVPSSSIPKVDSASRKTITFATDCCSKSSASATFSSFEHEHPNYPMICSSSCQMHPMHFSNIFAKNSRVSCDRAKWMDRSRLWDRR